MSKKPPKAAASADLLAARIVHEQEWAYGRWLEHLSWPAMRALAIQSPKKGGLGYDLSLDALRGLVAGYKDTHGIQTMTHAEYVERELHDLDMLQREAARAIVEQREHPPMDAQGNVKRFAGDAAKLYADLGEKRRKLLGLDQPVKIEAEVVHRDAVTEELDAMLARLDVPAAIDG